MLQRINKANLINLESNVISALAKYAGTATIPVGGGLIASKDLQAQIQTHVDALNALSDAHAKLSQLVELVNQQRGTATTLLTGARNFAAGAFGERSPEFAAFGFKPKKATQRTVESKADAIEKLRATRTARHTMGKRQRSAIHGVVPAATPTPNPVVSPSAPTTLVVVAPPVVTQPVVAPPTPVVSPPVNAGTNGAPAVSTVMNGASH